ncbi:HAMP domain-containing histidine kinase [Reichenbachiella carrageenanivorans]|uniref:histidine kinase n=1 Tax=Reichenbachiella carrageenanivorans TaxID=2979869 RepID=A0ABY6CXV2_9BACT|nr:HAMP domain-containing sensor histidine kinase [Reichenbachiella carrageenanivorans]UXX78737.1 HAMP domain-containing histidine kinase [Reichenbachiella carrageenanivorans]
MKPDYNKILNRQIHKYANGQDIPKELSPLFDSISKFYDTFERDQKLVERVMDLSSDELMNSNSDLKKLNEEMDRFVYSTSHDLRAPLLSILGLLNIIENENTQYDIKGYLKLLRDSTVKLDRFISDIIDYSRNTRLDINCTAVDFTTLIDDSFKHLNYMPGCSTLLKLINVDEHTKLYSDDRRLSIIFNNLISNAIKYQKSDIEDSFINIEAEINPNELKVEIEDNGIGIEEQYLDHIFNMFYRASPEAKGSGLGLYIVQETLEKLKGKITVESTYNVGTKFVVTIPNMTLDTLANK